VTVPRPHPALFRLALLIAWLTGLAGPARTEPAPRPHIVYIVADDLGWKDVGFHGSDIRTPNLDRLAATGMRLESFYAQPLCTPSRAALMTGRYPFRYGLQTGVILSGQTYGLATDEWLMPQALHEAGYETSIVGKWHLGHGRPETWPRQRGFDHQYGPLLGEIDYFTHQAHGVTDWYRDNVRVNEPGYVTQLLGREAVKQIETHDPKKPLFLYLTFTAPHSPYQAPKEYLDRYAAIADPTRRAYAAMITCMDDEIGRVMTALEKRGMWKNTLVIFQSDNGGNRSAMYGGEIDVSKLTLPSDNGPYRDGKGSLYEGGTRVVAVASWPGHVKSGITNQVVHEVDMFPTLAKLAGGSATRGKPLDGMDVWPTISSGATSPRTEVVYNIEPFRGALRQGDWKLVWHTPLPPKLELFNVKEDSSEKINVAARHPDKVAELQRRIEALSHDSARPLFLLGLVPTLKGELSKPPALPNDDAYFNYEP
jgi:arylsulfatase A-like enzyme